MENKLELSISNLTFSYDKKKNILKGINTTFSPGKITAILGANGCGKSTLLNILSGVLKPNSGVIKLNGKDISTLKRIDIAKKIAVVHQSNTAPADMTVRKLVSAGRTPYHKFLHSFDKDTDNEAIHSAMLNTDIIDYADTPISNLSGGQMQRVWLALALAQQTGILLLDEITTYLDIHYQLEIMHLISELNKKHKLTILMVLHDINLALEFCDEVIIMKNGNIISQGNINDAINEEILNKAFDVSSNIISIDGKKTCIFSRKGGTNV